MWTFILIGLNIISMVYGYASGYFPETCGTMLPLHGADPQTSKPPYEVSYQQGHVRDPITGMETIGSVFLESCSSPSIFVVVIP